MSQSPCCAMLLLMELDLQAVESVGFLGFSPKPKTRIRPVSPNPKP